MENYLVETEIGFELRQDLAIELYKFEKTMKELKAKEDEIKKIILEEMEQNNILKLQNENISISYVKPTTRETFDSKTFKEECPDIYDNYVKISNVKSSIRIKVN